MHDLVTTLAINTVFSNSIHRSGERCFQIRNAQHVFPLLKKKQLHKKKKKISLSFLGIAKKKIDLKGFRDSSFVGYINES